MRRGALKCSRKLRRMAIRFLPGREELPPERTCEDTRRGALKCSRKLRRMALRFLPSVGPFCRKGPARTRVAVR